MWEAKLDVCHCVSRVLRLLVSVILLSGCADLTSAAAIKRSKASDAHFMFISTEGKESDEILMVSVSGSYLGPARSLNLCKAAGVASLDSDCDTRFPSCAVRTALRMLG